MTYGNDEVFAEEEVDLTEVDDFRWIDIVGGAQHNEHEVAIVFDLRVAGAP